MLFDLFARRNCCRPQCGECCGLPESCGCECFPARVVSFGSGVGNALTLTADAGAGTNTAVIGACGAVVKYAPPDSFVALTAAEQAAAFILGSAAVVGCFSASMIISAPPESSSAAVYAALFSAPPGSDVFGLVPGSTLVLASGVAPGTPVGSVFSASVRMNARVCGKLAVMMFTTDVAPSVITGYAQGGILLS